MVRHSSEHTLDTSRLSPSSVSDGSAGLSPRTLSERVISVLESAELEMVFQPAMRLDEPRIEFFEALARFPAPSPETPDVWFEAAADVGLGAELEMLAARCALRGVSALPMGSSVSINLSPATIVSSVFAEQMSRAPLERIIFEITEKHPVSSYDSIIQSLKPFRDAGLRIAVDDAGAGHSSFRHILQIRPDIIKLDATICRGIHKDQMRQALASALITFSRQIGSELVAEGVETASELNSLRSLGMCIIQGNIIARPMSLDRISTVERPEGRALPPESPHLVADAA